MAIPVHYDLSRVLLSFLLSLLASWAALDLAGRVTLQRSKRRAGVWLGVGAFAMGSGIWSMHYVGMLAWHAGMTVLYDWPTVLLSLLAAIVASAVALFLVSRKTLSPVYTVIGSLVMGTGIALMHYIGMAAMRMEARITYSAPLVALSVVAAVLISLAALRLTFHSRGVKTTWSPVKAGSALLMGLAIPVMHYLGMAAATWTMAPGSLQPWQLQHSVMISNLSTTAVVLVVGIVLTLTLVSAAFDRRFTRVQTDLRSFEESNDLLSRHSSRLQTVFRANGVGIWEFDVKSRLFYVDDLLRVMYGLEGKDQAVSCDRWAAKVHPEDRKALGHLWCEALASGDKYENEYRVVLQADGEVFRYRTAASILRSETGEPVRVLGMSWDVTAERKREQETADAAERFRMILESIGDAVIATDQQRQILFVNRAASELTGWSPAEATGRALQDVFVTRDAESGQLRRDPVQRCMEGGGTLLAEDGILTSRAGSQHNIQKHVALTGQGCSAVITFRDITQSRRLERDLKYAASHDGLTGLANRVTFEKTLTRLWEENRFNSRTHCLCVLDLDRFKIINDTSGHMAGDALLREIAQLLQSGVRSTDLVARMGGDEYMLLLIDSDAEQGRQTAERLVRLVSELRFPWQDRIYDITASLGLVLFDCFSPDPDTMISQADIAAFTSKRDGYNRVTLYLEDKHGLTKSYQEMEVAADLRRCIEEDCFELHAQPIVGIDRQDEANYFELLIRMRDTKGDLVSPAYFIPAAERYGMMNLIDRWVFSTALDQYAAQAGGCFCLSFAINLSAQSLCDPTLLAFVNDEFTRTGVPRSCITFEVTETGLIQNLDQAQAFLQQVKKAGSRVALDDFGTGLSSLSYLKQFPLNTLKIDGSFIRQLTSNPLDQTIIQAVSQIARSMDATTVAECVEDQATIALLRTLGVDYVQGWATGRPAPLAEVLAARFISTPRSGHAIRLVSSVQVGPEKLGLAS